jgi:hypothetical protein
MAGFNEKVRHCDPLPSQFGTFSWSLSNDSFNFNEFFNGFLGNPRDSFHECPASGGTSDFVPDGHIGPILSDKQVLIVIDSLDSVTVS